MYNRTTIAAIATPPGRGGVGVIRLSGPKSYEIAQALTQKELPKARFAGFRQFYDASGEVMDEGLAICFPNPNSFTGEDVVELQGHGGPYWGVCWSSVRLQQKPVSFPCVLLKMANWIWYRLKQSLT
jgi:tRNA U34 5-carboxymethylaminomethyl modifying GTPase MnmE/TrmE